MRTADSIPGPGIVRAKTGPAPIFASLDARQELIYREHVYPGQAGFSTIDWFWSRCLYAARIPAPH